MSNPTLEQTGEQTSARTLLVCCGTGCLANDAKGLVDAFEEALLAANSEVTVRVDASIKQTGCNGFCENGPIVKIHPDDISYYKVRQKHVKKIIESLGGEPVESLLYRGEDKQRVTRQIDNPFYASQLKIALRNIGEIDPLSLADYKERGGYEALKIALSLQPEEIIKEITASGLRGRGGAGFPTGVKWNIAAGYESNPKYVVCNGDEGDPGAFMDRSMLEGDPHSVLEGLAIAALAIGAEKGFLYIRDEYGLAVKNVEHALSVALDEGILGENVMGSGRSLSFELVRGGGAFVCGESTALMASIEGRIGEPRAKYIRSVERGLWDQPTVLNNVETLACVPYIIANGSSEFAKLGTKDSCGTKVFSLVGKVKRTGLVEVPMGTTLRHLIYDIGGGISQDREFKAVQTGGPSGGCIPQSLLDLPVDYESLTEAGAMMGSGGMIVMDDRSCIVEVARYYTRFLCEESCGKCTPCREGLRQMEEILTGICEGRGELEDIDLLLDISQTVSVASLCALGKTAANPVMSSIKYFRPEFEQHIVEHVCSAGVCAHLTSFYIDANTCTSCGACKKACPSHAVLGDKSQAYSIDESACIACGSCRDTCKFDAVLTKGRLS